jgi:hypothetical protein
MVWVANPNWLANGPAEHKVKLEAPQILPDQSHEKPLICESDLPDSGKVHPVFHGEKLAKLPWTHYLPDQELGKPPAKKIGGGLECPVERVLAARVWRGKLQYMACGRGWDEGPEWHMYMASNFRNRHGYYRSTTRTGRKTQDARRTSPCGRRPRRTPYSLQSPDREGDNMPEKTGPIRILRRPGRR